MPKSIVATGETSPNGVPRVRLAVTWTDSPVPATVTIYRETAGERDVVRQGAPLVLSAGLGTAFDYEAPFTTSSRWVVSDGSTEVFSSTLTPSSSGPWLVHPGRPEESVPLRVMEWPSFERPIEQAVFQPVGRRAALAISGVRGSERGTLTVYTEGASAKADLLRILADGAALLVKGTSAENAGTYWAAVGNVTESPGSFDLSEFSVWTLPLVVVDPPTGTALPDVTFADATAAFLSFADALTRAPTFADRTAGNY